MIWFPVTTSQQRCRFSQSVFVKLGFVQCTMILTVGCLHCRFRSHCFCWARRGLLVSTFGLELKAEDECHRSMVCCSLYFCYMKWIMKWLWNEWYVNGFLRCILHASHLVTVHVGWLYISVLALASITEEPLAHSMRQDSCWLTVMADSSRHVLDRCCNWHLSFLSLFVSVCPHVFYACHQPDSWYDTLDIAMASLVYSSWPWCDMQHSPTGSCHLSYMSLQLV